jgi:hypothetical protein
MAVTDDGMTVDAAPINNVLVFDLMMALQSSRESYTAFSVATLMVEMEEQLLNALAEMLVTLAGMERLASDLQKLNA